MKKIMVLLVVLVMTVTGCTAINQFLCKPTAVQIEAANVGKAVAQAILVAAATFSGSGLVGIVSAQAIPVFDKVISGYCVAQGEWDNAVTALTVANTQTKSMAVKAGGKMKAAPAFPTDIDNDLIYIGGVKW